MRIVTFGFLRYHGGVHLFLLEVAGKAMPEISPETKNPSSVHRFSKLKTGLDRSSRFNGLTEFDLDLL